MITVLLWLLLIGTAAAAEEQCSWQGRPVACAEQWDFRVGPTGTVRAPNSWKIITDDSKTIVTCNESKTRCWTPCEEKLREAVREVMGWMERKGDDVLWKLPQPHAWAERHEKTLKECLK